MFKSFIGLKDNPKQNEIFKNDDCARRVLWEFHERAFKSPFIFIITPKKTNLHYEGLKKEEEDNKKKWLRMFFFFQCCVFQLFCFYEPSQATTVSSVRSKQPNLTWNKRFGGGIGATCCWWKSEKDEEDKAGRQL
jgi:hypothetical protein